MTIFITLLLTVLTFGFIVSPFFRQKMRLVDSVEDDKSQELYSKRDTTYSMLKELEFDYKSGILAKEDFQELEARYKKKAIATLKDIDSLEKGVDADEEDGIEKQVAQLRQSKAPNLADDIEKEIARLRRGKTADVSDEVEQEIAQLRRNKASGVPQKNEKNVAPLRQSQGQFCTQCGTRHGKEDHFCARCGARLK